MAAEDERRVLWSRIEAKRWIDGDEAMRQVIVYPGEDGYWVVECPTLPGCISQGKTREEAIQNIREAIDAYVAALAEDGLAGFPEERFELLTVVV